MSRKRKVASVFGTGAVILALLGAFSTQTLRQEPAYQTLPTSTAYSLTCEKTISPYTRQKSTPEPDIRPLSAYARKDRVIAPPTPQPSLVDEKTANVKANGTQPTEIDFEPQKPNATTEILTTKEPPRGNPTPEPVSAPTPSRKAPVEPKMGDTRIVDGQKQVYFLGFGWIEDNDTPNVGITVDGDGDINKMVGTMD